MHPISLVGIFLALACIFIGLRRPTPKKSLRLRQLTRHPGNEVALERYRMRLEAAGLGTGRNVRVKE